MNLLKKAVYLACLSAATSNTYATDLVINSTRTATATFSGTGDH